MTGKELREQLIIAREEYIQLIKAEMLGPGSEFSTPDVECELISSSPISRYSVGILYPQGNQTKQDSDETVPVIENENADSDDSVSAENNVTDILFPDNTADTPSPSVRKHYEYDETANENLDEEVCLSSQYLPASMGITFLVKGISDKLCGNITFATYKNAKVPDCVIPYSPENPEGYSVPPELAHVMVYDSEKKILQLLTAVKLQDIKRIFEKDTIPENEYKVLKQIAYKFADFCNNGYVRVPHASQFEIDFSKGNYAVSNTCIDDTTAKITALRTMVGDNIWSVTVMLVNDLIESPAKAYHCLFQARVEINSAENDFVFAENNPISDIYDMDDEERNLELLYRNKKTFATGLGVSANWSINDAGVGSLWTDFFPQAEVPAMSFDLPLNDTLSAADLSMKRLSDLSHIEKTHRLASLVSLVDLYKSWVSGLESIASVLDERYRSAAAKNIAECKRAYERMYSGIETLRENNKAYSAFLLANRAMFMQRVHLRIQSETADAERYQGDQVISKLLLNMEYINADDIDCKWRPFQLAFLLMDIDSVVDDRSPDRNLVDLIWFPTGGGKTEAYLGLTAFVIFYRRLTHPSECSGTAVIMRYTLRLLAAQQFTRAATLICACEYIRRDCEAKLPKYIRYPLGSEPITIGLWIGGSHTPNKNDDAKRHLDKLLSVKEHYYVRNEKDRHNKFQVLKCPWCGTKMVKDDKEKALVGKWGYAMNGKHFYMFCPHEDCEFTQRLPIQIVDEELYNNPPTLLFGTVDKFAMMPWNGRVSSFFATGNNSRTPELIIQDELHLISGALGTMVGLYETAVDAACGQKGVKPKIIASTATIRRAKEQCSVLYNRDVVQFPAPGLDSADSFFAREAQISYADIIYGRKYVGIMPSGKTKAMAEIRAMAALLQRLYMMQLPDEAKDKLWTLTTYFNSLKDLGKASTLVDDDVKDSIIRTANRLFSPRRLIVGSDELTSRVTTTELNETLDKLEKLEYSQRNVENKRYASNVLLATNMISVGIDVARLNVMLMIGQPKLTSEYIQASSRVGRSFPGVAFVQYDATKSRDRSHYESFKSYHESFYRFVEPTGATPFSTPARERALHSVLTAMMRQCSDLSEDKDAANFDKDYFVGEISAIKEFITNRVKGISDRANNSMTDDLAEVVSEMDDFFSHWQNLVDNCNIAGTERTPLFFGYRFIVTPPAAGAKRLLKPYNSPGQDTAFETLTSMRNVDSQVKGEVIIWEEK